MVYLYKPHDIPTVEKESTATVKQKELERRSFKVWGNTLETWISDGTLLSNILLTKFIICTTLLSISIEFCLVSKYMLFTSDSSHYVFPLTTLPDFTISLVLLLCNSSRIGMFCVSCAIRNILWSSCTKAITASNCVCLPVLISATQGTTLHYLCLSITQLNSRKCVPQNVS